MELIDARLQQLSILFPNPWDREGAGGGGGGSSAVERATPGQEVPVRFPLRPPAPYWLGRCQYNVTG